ncbi:LuxR C-terminal-related transcriptional regulator [Streptomyces sp. NPDC054995]
MSGIELIERERSTGLRTRVLLIEQDPISRHVLTAILERDDQMEVVSADDPEDDDAVGMAAHAEAVIVSIGPGQDIPGFVAELTACHGKRVLLVSSSWSGRLLDSALAAGVTGCLLKEAAMPNLVGAVRAVHAGLSVISPQIHRRMMRREAGWDASVTRERPGEPPMTRLVESLSPRERQVLWLLAESRTTSEVADQLLISPTTVKSHVSNALTKLGARNRVQAVLAVREFMARDAGGAPGGGRAGWL